MSEWIDRKLKELGILERGKSKHRPRYAFHLFNGKYPFIQTGEVRQAKKYITSYEKTYNDLGLAQSKLWPKGTLCITIAANIAELAILNFDACFPDSILGFIADEKKVDVDFIYYTLLFFQEKLKHIGEGSVQDNINLGTFEDIKFPIPNLTEQKAIASVLSSLDDKIDLLHRQNKTLEAMAETLFRQWFIEEAEDDWESKKLIDFCDIKNGYAFKSSSYKPKGYPVIRTLNFNNHKLNTKNLVFLDNIDAEKYGKFNLKRKDFLLVMVGASLGNYSIVTQDILPALQNQNMWCFRCHDEKYQFYLNHALLKIITENLYSASGSAREFFQKNVFYEFSMPIPPLKLVEQFDNMMEAFFTRLEINLKQIQTLENLRDTLLPKLMSGEVRVKVNEKSH